MCDVSNNKSNFERKEERKKVREDDKNVSNPKAKPMPPATSVSTTPEERKKVPKQKTQQVPPTKVAFAKEQEKNELEDDNLIKTSTLEAVTLELEIEVAGLEDDRNNEHSNTEHLELSTSASKEMDSLVDAM